MSRTLYKQGLIHTRGRMTATSLVRNDRGQVAQRVVGVAWSERREMNVMPGESVLAVNLAQSVIVNAYLAPTGVQSVSDPAASMLVPVRCQQIR
jgi:hypothetical protein